MLTSRDANTSNISNLALANALRSLSVDMVYGANSGHVGMPLGMADVLMVLYRDFLKFNPKDPHWPARDRLVLSAGHGSAALYSALYLSGYEDVQIKDLKNFRKLHSMAAGHPEYNTFKGVEVTTGPLGQGIANAVGMSISSKMLEARFGTKMALHNVYAVCGDGCLMEGVAQEAISLAGHLQLSNLILLFDDNGISIDGDTSLCTSDDHVQRFRGCSWATIVVNGHDYNQIFDAIEKANNETRPTVILFKTKIGFGSPDIEGKASAHGFALDEDKIAKLKRKLMIDYPSFEVPQEIISPWRAFYLRNIDLYNQWQDLFDKNKDMQDFLNFDSGTLPQIEMLKIASNEATRKSSGAFLEKLSQNMPQLVGGSADLSSSNLTKTSTQKPITRDDFSGNYIYYGVREHAMCAIASGILLSGAFRPYVGTFLVFSDYARPAIRLSAIMGLPNIYIMTHDSIGVGEDGPTHQPIEHLASLRAMPNLYVCRPCDAIEVTEIWQLAIKSQNKPHLIALSRQNVPQIRKNIDRNNNLSAKGAYYIKSTKEPQSVVIFASGSEVQIGLQVAQIIEEKMPDIGVSVVSVVCDRLFKEQSDNYKQKIIPDNCVKVAIEAASSYGWHYFVGSDGMLFTIDEFGASGRASDLFSHFGLDAIKISKAILDTKFN